MYISNNQSITRNSLGLFKENILTKFNSIDAKVKVISLAIFALIMTGVSLYLYMANRKLKQKLAQSNTNAVETKPNQDTEKGKIVTAPQPSTDGSKTEKVDLTPVDKPIPSRITLVVKTLTDRAPQHYELSSEQTIGSLKARMHVREGILPWENRLVFQGKDLEDNIKIKDYYRDLKDLASEATIFSVKKVESDAQLPVMVSVKIRTLIGNIYNCEYFPEETVGCLKSRIHEKQGTPYWQIQLIKAGKELSDDTLMKDCKFGNDEPVLHLLVKLK